MRRTLAAMVVVIGLVSACSGSAATQPGATQATGTQADATQPGATQVATGAVGTATAGAQKTLDACSLITATEAAAALGEPVDPGTVPTPGARSCIFAGHPATGIEVSAVEISITGVAGFNPDKPSIPGLTITKVAGIGDAAYYVSIGAGLVVLNVRKGQTTFTTSVLRKALSDTELQSAEKALALLILGRI